MIIQNMPDTQTPLHRLWPCGYTWGMKKALFLFNPHAGKGKIVSNIATITDILTKAGYLVTAYPTQSKGDATEKILMWGGYYDRIVVGGGDGMLHEAVNGVMNLTKPVDLAYIPSGTINDFANTHKIPRDIESAAQIAAGDSRSTIDVGLFGDTYFSYVAAFGAVTDVTYTTNQDAKNAFGFLAYLTNALKYVDLRKLMASARTMEIRSDRYVFTGEFVLGCVSNSHSLGSLKQLVPDNVELKDGLMEGLFVQKPKNITHLGHILDLLMSGNMDRPEILSTRSEKYEIITEEDTAWTLDGEDGGIHHSVTVRDCKQKLTMILP